MTTKYSNSLASLSAVTTATTGTEVDVTNADKFSVFVTAADTGTISVVVTIEVKNGSTWYQLDQRTLSAAGSYVVASDGVHAQGVRVVTSSHTDATVSADVRVASVR